MFTHYDTAGPMSGSATMFLLKERFKENSWTVEATGGGSEGWFSASSDGISHSGSGPGGMDENFVWFRLRASASVTPVREFLFQRDNTEDEWFIWYSSDGVGFVSGSPDATTVPTAADGKQLMFGDDWLPDRETYWVDMFFGDEEEEFSFGFYTRGMGEYLQGRTLRASLFLDVLTRSVDKVDPDPAVVCISQDGTGFIGFHYNSDFFEVTDYLISSRDRSQAVFGWFNKGSQGEDFVNYGATMFGQENGSDMDPSMAYFEQNPYTAEWDSWPIWYVRGTPAVKSGRARSKSGYKGNSRIFKLSSFEAKHAGLSRDKTRIHFGCVNLPFSGSFILV